MYDRNILIEQTDPELFKAIQLENARQEHHIELIASENYASPAVMAAQGTQLTNKYAEGYPGKRYYGGCEYVDIAEQLAIDRVKQIFGADCANVQPHCGASANEAVFLAFLKPGDTIMGMSLAEGGHLTHGMPLNMSGKWFNVVSYGLDAQEAIDYEAMERKARECQAQAHHRRRLGLQPAHRLRTLCQGGQGCRRHLHGRHGPLRRPDRRGRLPQPRAARRRGDLHHPQEPARPRGGIILMKAQHEKAINSAIFPGLQGGPLMHVIAAKAVAFKEALDPSFKRTSSKS
jgi:glycine hydroxymethyltransferase